MKIAVFAILTLALFFAGLLTGLTVDRYELNGADSGLCFIFDKWTGDVWVVRGKNIYGHLNIHTATPDTNYPAE